MRIRITPNARSDLLGIFEHISAENPVAAIEQVERVRKVIRELLRQPRMGKRGRRLGTHELVIDKTPFVVVYRILSEGELEVLRVWHGRQLGRPPR